MATIQIRNLPDETVRQWKVRAAVAGQSLQEYMRAYLTAEAQKPTVEELVARIESRSHERPAHLDLEETLRGIEQSRD